MPSPSRSGADSSRPDVRAPGAITRRITCAALLLCLPPASVSAQGAILDRYQRLEQMHHTAFTAREGLAGVPLNLAQTTDGFLWIGTSNGLLRYDGVQFERYRPERGDLPAVAVSALAASPDGGLWVGHARGGVSFISADGDASHYSTDDGVPVGTVRSIAVDHDGGVWLAAVGGLARLEGRRWQVVRMDWNYPNKSAWKLFVERDGTLWVAAATPDRILFLPKGTRKFIDVGVTTSALAFAQVSDSIVAWADLHDATVIIMRRHPDSASRLQTIGDLPSQGLVLDRDGGLWVAGYDVTRLRFTPADSGRGFAPGPVERVTRSEGLTGRISAQVFIDREGTTWVTTDAGLDRFRRRNLAWAPDTTVLGGASFVADRDGQVWMMSYRDPSIRRAADLKAVRGAPAFADNGFPDRDGSLWFGTMPGLARWNGKQITSIPAPADVIRKKDRFMVISGTSDSTGRVWASVGGYGVYSWKDSAWTFHRILPGHPDLSPIAMHSDADAVWLLYRDEIARVRGDSIRVFSRADGLDVGALQAIRASGRELWAGGERGLARLEGNRFRSVQVADGGELGSVSGIAPSDGGLWLASSIGIVHIAAAEIEKVIASSAYRVRPEVLGVDSDLPDPLMFANTSRAFQPTAAGADGVIWFATMNGIARVDPRLIVRNPLPPPVVIRSVTADDSVYSTRALILPPLTRTLRIGYSALSLANPERVHFRYRLEGWEDTWHEAGSRREVSYTGLNPGRYTFRVAASNNDGVWNQTGAALPFSVAPAWYQATWFHALMAALLLALVVTTWQYRLRRVSAMLSARFDARLEERTRIARDLHDTLLQTVQGSRMVADDALERASDPEYTRRALERLSAWLAQAAHEGRAALNSLRGANPAVNDLAASLRSAAGTAAQPPLTISAKVTGTPRELHPVVRDEVYRVGYEAIRNAAVHANARSLEILVEYGHDLTLRITDDGIGIDPSMAGTGKQGHYGLRGMRERAAGIGATLTISGASPGTRVTLVVPGRSVFQGHAGPHTKV